jgi:hypothetical protein
VVRRRRGRSPPSAVPSAWATRRPVHRIKSTSRRSRGSRCVMSFANCSRVIVFGTPVSGRCRRRRALARRLSGYLEFVGLGQYRPAGRDGSCGSSRREPRRAVLTLTRCEGGEVVDEALDVGAADVADPLGADVRDDVRAHGPGVRLGSRARARGRCGRGTRPASGRRSPRSARGRRSTDADIA